MNINFFILIDLNAKIWINNNIIYPRLFPYMEHIRIYLHAHPFKQKKITCTQKLKQSFQFPAISELPEIQPKKIHNISKLDFT